MPDHPNVIHEDDVDVVELDQGDLGARRRRLAAAADARQIGVSRWEIAPGRRSTPPHVHSSEEEVFWVLGGSGLAWQDGRSYAIGAGDCLVQRKNGAAHTLRAGDDGLDVLVFAEGTDESVTYMPRTKMFWLGKRWVPADGPHPFAADAALGPMQWPEPEAERPANIVNADDVAWESYDDAGMEGAEQMVSVAAGSRDVGLRRTRLAAGSASCPPHFHLAEEECFYVLSGSGRLVLGDESVELRPGTFAVRPPATHVAHVLVGGDDGLEYLGFGQNRTHEVVFYPRSKKVNISGIMFRIEPVDYLDGELG